MVAGFYAATCSRNMPPLRGPLLRRRTNGNLQNTIWVRHFLKKYQRAEHYSRTTRTGTTADGVANGKPSGSFHSWPASSRDCQVFSR
jgi:hypothetical protein